MPEFQRPTDMNQVTDFMQQLQQQLVSLSERVNQHDAKNAAHRPDPSKIAKKKMAAGRLFKTSATKGPQGFQYVYIGRSGKILRSEIRRNLKKVGVNTSRILDLNFPGSKAIGVLLHTQYVDEFLSLLRERVSGILTDFDPLDPANIADPKYDDMTENDRISLIAEMVNARSVDALSHLRPLNVSSVGRWFLNLGWIDQAELDEAVAAAIDRLKEKDPKKAAFLFKRPRASSTDSEMDI
ncbi:unnamed protein product [Mucor fragilis]